MRRTQALHRHLAQLGALNLRAVGALRHRESKAQQAADYLRGLALAEPAEPEVMQLAA